MKWTPRLLKWGLTIYGPYLGAGVKIHHISKDWRTTKVSMGLKWYNRNIMGVHFGGSLYSMVDPHFMLMLLQVLGRSYFVWDKSAQIDFIKPGKGRVSALLHITDQDIDEIKMNTENGEKYFHIFTVDILDEQKTMVAQVKKTLYVKKKPSE